MVQFIAFPATLLYLKIAGGSREAGDPDRRRGYCGSLSSAISWTGSALLRPGGGVASSREASRP